MPWSCAQTEDRLSDSLDGLLGPEDRAEFETHLAGCPRCGALFNRLSAILGRLHALAPLELPPRLVPKVLHQTLGPRSAKLGVRRWYGWLPAVWQPRFAMAAVSIAATFLIVFQSLGIHPGRLKVADLNPVYLYRAADRHAHLLYGRGVKFINDLRVVYEIQSRLRPEGPPEATPEPGSAPPGPRQKSQRGEPRGHSANQGSILAASVVASGPGRYVR